MNCLFSWIYMFRKRKESILETWDRERKDYDRGGEVYDV